MVKTVFYAALMAAFGVSCSAPAFAQARPDVLVKQRQAAMILQGKYFGPLDAMQQGKIPFDKAAAERNAAYLDVLAKLAWDGFSPATKGEKTRALPAVFTDTAKFKQAQDNFQAEATKLAQLTKAGDETSIKNQINAVNKACASCHDDFRERR